MHWPGSAQMGRHMTRQTQQPGATLKSAKSKWCGRPHLQAGQTTIEVAIVMPLLLVMTLAVIDLGRYAYAGILVGNAARAGAAYGAAAPGDSTGIVNAACNDFLSNLGSNPAPSCDGSSSAT